MGMAGDDADMVLRSLQKVILSTRIKSVCNLGVWCISVQQLNTSFLDAHIESLVRAIVHALDNPTGSLSTTFEAMQAVMKLETQVNEKMRETSYLWGPPIYRRLVSVDKRERDMSERCLRKIKSLICPPPAALSKVHKEIRVECHCR
ncbi:putative telomere-associated protein Rif1 [Helianthus annuus]|nr:putative telomere-associated protein Rif1 [Helianthus annuus]